MTNEYDWEAFKWFVGGVVMALMWGWIAYALYKGYLVIL